TEETATEETATEETATEETATEETASAETATEETASAETATAETATAETVTDKKPAPRASKKEARELRRRARREKRHKKREKLISAFKDYFDFSEKISKIPPHRVLAINRGDRSRVLRVKLDLDPTPLQEQAEKILIPADHPQREFLVRCLRDALHRLATPSIDREVRRELNDQAESRGVAVFVRNLRNLLLQPPVPQRRILAIDPGYRSGCKLAMLDECGNVLAHDVVCIVGKTADLPGAKKRIAEWVHQYDASVIAIGNGAACRDTEQLVSTLLADELKDHDVAYAITNEAGASVYSTSSIGREELPDLDPVTRSAVSIGRRLLDPLSELVKINPANIGVGLYQHDVKAKHLRDSLDAVVESCVNFVGVDVNTASPALLCYVSGLNQLSARRIYEHRQEHGPFASRSEVLNVSGVGEASYVQAAGFLRVVGGENPLDGTWIHPESYETAGRILEKLGVAVGEPIGDVDVPAMAKELDVGEHLLADILAALIRPGHDPRQDLPAPIFRRGIVKLEDLESGMELDGTVLNVVDFGAFVDIGLSDSGLVHISRLANQYIKDPHDVVSVGDVLKVWVVDVDQKRRRVSLTAIQPGTERAPRPPRGKGRKPEASSHSTGGRANENRQDQKSTQQPSRGKRQRFQKSKPPAPKHKSREFIQKKKKAPPITEEMAEGSEPMRSFSDLAQFFDGKPDDRRDDK
ncbi:MAG TPA: S1 RNA-binding domain-containing protein, partial [Planctomycetaceae bacterium]|nr:S1 RNA-binding domain-containing protein [Planctomycetaceae bacterium]